MALKLLRWITLALPAAVVAEFLLGDQYLGGTPAPAGAQIGELLLYIVFYGSAAITIREVARRLRRGWPTMLLLGLAWGVIEEGLVTQSLFNPHYLGAGLLRDGFIPGVGTAGPWLVYVLALHMIWSTATPIALAEAIAAPPAGQPQRPWFGRFALVLFPVLTLLGGIAVFLVSVPTDRHYAPNPLELLGAAVAAILLIGAALLRRPTAPIRRTGVVVGIVLAFVLLSALQLLDHALPKGMPWLEVGGYIGALVILGVLVAVLRPAPVGLATGALLTYGWLGLTKAIPLGPVAATEQIVLVVLAVAFAAAAIARDRSSLAGQQRRTAPAR